MNDPLIAKSTYTATSPETNNIVTAALSRRVLFNVKAPIARSSGATHGPALPAAPAANASAGAQALPLLTARNAAELTSTTSPVPTLRRNPFCCRTLHACSSFPAQDFGAWKGRVNPD